MKKNLKLKIVIFLICLSLISTTVFLKVYADTYEEIDKYRGDISQKSEKINDLETKMEANEKNIKKINKDIEKLEKSNHEQEEKIAKLNGEINNITDDNQGILNFLQKYKNINKVNMIFSFENHERSATDFFTRIHSVNLVTEMVGQEIKVLSEKVSEEEKLQNQIELNIKSTSEKKKDLEKKEKALENDKKNQEKQIDELKKEMSKLIDKYASEIMQSDTSGVISQKKQEALMKEVGIKESDYIYVDYIVTKESSWNYTAINSMSGAYGLCQALPPEKMSQAGDDWRVNPVTQLSWCNSYAKERYGTWKKAYSFHKANNWW